MLDYIVISFKHGGWMLLPIFLASFWAWFLVIRTCMRLWRLSLWKWTCNRLIRNPDQIDDWIAKYSQPQLEKTIAGAILYRLSQVPRSASREEYELQLDEVLKWRLPESEKEISMIGAIAGMAPLLGLLGTVSGMIHTFDVISAFGTSNPALMADSISEALVTTQDGLVVALPLMIIHMALSNYQRRIEDSASELANTFIQRRTI